MSAKARKARKERLQNPKIRRCKWCRGRYFNQHSHAKACKKYAKVYAQETEI